MFFASACPCPCAEVSGAGRVTPSSTRTTLSSLDFVRGRIREKDTVVAAMCARTGLAGAGAPTHIQCPWRFVAWGESPHSE